MGGTWGDWVVTLSQVLRGERVLDELNVAPKLFDRRLGQQGEGNCAAACGQFGSSNRIADHRRCLLQPALPVRFARVPKYQSVRVKARGIQHGARQFQKVWPCRINADQST